MALHVDFFTKELWPGVRPVTDPENNKVIVSACKSALTHM